MIETSNLANTSPTVLAVDALRLLAYQHAAHVVEPAAGLANGAAWSR